MSQNIFSKNTNGHNNGFSATSSAGQPNAAKLQRDLNALLDEVRDAGLSLPADLLQTGGRKHRRSGSSKNKKHSRSHSQSGGKKAKKVAKKVSKKSRSHSHTGGKAKKTVKKVVRKSHEHSKSRSRSRSHSRKQSRELPAGMIAHQEFVRFLQKELDLKGGVIVNMLAKVYKDIAKKNNPDVTDSVKLAEKAKEVFLKEKSSGKPKQRLNEIESSRGSKKSAKGKKDE